LMVRVGAEAEPEALERPLRGALPWCRSAYGGVPVG
jgi:hypothetical protein